MHNEIAWSQFIPNIEMSGIVHFIFKHEQLKKEKMDAIEKKLNNLVKDTAFH